MAKTLKLNPSQKRDWEIIRKTWLTPEQFGVSKSEYMLTGSAGSGKTFLPLSLFVHMCILFKNTRWAVINVTDTLLKTSTLPSFEKVLEGFGGIKPKMVNMTATFPSGSQILFLNADSKDPEGNKFKGLELTSAFVDEVDRITQQQYHMIKSRCGRWRSDSMYEMVVPPPNTEKERRIRPVLFSTCNPNGSWVKTDYYDKYKYLCECVDAKKRGEDVYIDKTKSLPNHVYFSESSVLDNIENVGVDYIRSLMALPSALRARVFEGRWDFEDRPDSLVKYEWYKDAIYYRTPDLCEGEKILAVDPADDGKDSTVILLLIGDVVIDIWKFPDAGCVESPKKIKKIADQYGVKPINIIIDAVGIGAGTAGTMMKDYGWKVRKFKGGESTKSKPNDFFEYTNANAESCWLLREAFENGRILVPNNPELQQETLAATWGSDDKKISFDKKKLKKAIGHSPDVFDALRMAIYHREKPSKKSFVMFTC